MNSKFYFTGFLLGWFRVGRDKGYPIYKFFFLNEDPVLWRGVVENPRGTDLNLILYSVDK